MKKTFLFLLLLLIPSLSFSEIIQLEWDYPDDQVFDGFYIYQKKMIQDEYDYDNPVATVAKDERSVRINADVIMDRVQTYNYVVRAYRGDEISLDSNQVSYVVVGKKPVTPVNLYAQYDKEQSIISLSWEQPPDEYDIYRWLVYYRLSDQTEFTELGSVSADADLIFTDVFTAAPDGIVSTVFFTVVAFRRDYAVFSENAAEISVDVDRQGPPIPVENLKINIDILVE